MAKRPDYASLYTLRADGRYQGYWHDAEGKRHTICDTDPARLYERIQKKEVPAEQREITFADAAEQWRTVRFEQLSYKSVEAYKPVFRRLTARFGAEVLEAIDTRDVTAYLASLAAQGYARRTVQLHRDMMSQIYNAAIGAGLTRYNPCDHAAMPKGLAAGTRGIAPENAIEAVKAGLDKPFGLFAFVCLYAGLRRGEALALRYQDVDRDAKLIHVTKSVQFIGNDPHIKEPKTKSGRRDVILLDVLSQALPKGEGYLFCRPDGSLLTKDDYAKRWAKYCEEIGCHITAHQLRHGYATLLYEAGVPDKDAQEQLGHANITLTRDVYTHISKKQRSKTAAKLNRYVEDLEKENDDTDVVVQEILKLMEGRDAREILTRLAAALAEN